MTAIFKIKNKKTDADKMVFVGAHLPGNTISYLALHSILFEISKSSLIRDAISKSVECFSKQNNQVQLEQKLVSRIQVEWKIYHATNPDATFSTFKIKVNRELTKKGISNDVIERILSYL